MRGDEDEAFAKEHTELVRRTAQRVKRQLRLGTELDELVGAGYVGLLEARQRYEEGRGVLFAAFAHYRIRGAIFDHVRQMGHLSRAEHARRRRAETADMALEAVEHVTPSDTDALCELSDVLGKLSAAFVLSASGADEGASPEEQVMSAFDHARVRRAMRALPARERLVVEGIYFEDRVLNHIGAELAITKSGVSRIHTRALARLRAAMDGSQSPDR